MKGLTRARLLLTAVPFALLINSSQVHMSLEIQRDGTARRVIAAEVNPYYKGEIGKWVNDVQAGRSWDRTWKGDRGTTYFYARDYNTQALNRDTLNGTLTIEDVFQNPLSIYTTYTWREEVAFSHLYPTDPGAASAAGKFLIYQVDMPGTVTGATVSVTKPSAEGAMNRAATRMVRAPEAVMLPFETAAEAQPSAPAGAPAAGAPAAPVGAPAAAPAAPTAGAPGAPAGSPTGPAAATPAAAPSATPAAQPTTPAATPATPAPAATMPTPGGDASKTPAAEATPASDGGTAPAEAPAGEAPKHKGAGSTVETEAGSAIFKLDASEESVTVEVTSQRLRWGYLVIVAYVLAFIVFKVLEGLQKAARLKPRKI